MVHEKMRQTMQTKTYPPQRSGFFYTSKESRDKSNTRLRLAAAGQIETVLDTRKEYMASSFFELVSLFAQSAEEDDAASTVASLLDDEGKKTFEQELRVVSLIDQFE